MSDNYGQYVFDGRPYYNTEELATIGMTSVGVCTGASSVCDYDFRKKYVLHRNTLKIMLIVGRPYETHSRIVAAIQDFVRESDLYKNSIRILEQQYHTSHALITLEAYINEKQLT